MSSSTDYAALLSLSGEAHVVVGAGMGIGHETARALASAGATVACVDIDGDRAAEVAGEVDGLAVICDVTVEGELDKALANSERELGPISGVSDIVGLTLWRPLVETTDDDWQEQNATVAGQALRTLRASAPLLRRAGGGAITFVASVSAFTSAPGHGLYGMSKSAILSMVRTAAVELGSWGVRVNAVSPGATRTPRVVANPRFDVSLRENARRTPLGKLAEPSDIAAALLFFASPLAAHVTGQELTVDGGLRNAWPLALPVD